MSEGTDTLSFRISCKRSVLIYLQELCLCRFILIKIFITVLYKNSAIEQDELCTKPACRRVHVEHVFCGYTGMSQHFMLVRIVRTKPVYVDLQQLAISHSIILKLAFKQILGE